MLTIETRGESRNIMQRTNRHSLISVSLSLAALLLFLVTVGCAPQTATKASGVKKAASKEQSGFLKDYSKLKPNPKLDESIVTYVNEDMKKNLHGYIAMIVDPVQVYVASDGDPSQIPAPNAERAALYFQSALIGAVQDAFPVVHEPGPLVLRLRSALVGVAAGGDIPATEGKPAEKALNITKLVVEIELVDSVTGEVIAAAVDKAAAGDGEVEMASMSREEKYQLAEKAMNAWAKRVRTFLNAAHELSPEDAAKADKSYKPYGGD
jgi:hypothetical protein